MEVTIGTLRLRGIIDRLELDAERRLIVTDYKTGKVPGQAQEQSRLGGVHFYAFLCEKVLGRRPDAVQLIYLTEPVSIVTTPHRAVDPGPPDEDGRHLVGGGEACEREDFRPKPSRLCDWCSYRAWCPAFGGLPSDAPSRLREPALVGAGVGAGAVSLTEPSSPIARASDAQRLDRELELEQIRAVLSGTTAPTAG